MSGWAQGSLRRAVCPRGARGLSAGLALPLRFGRPTREGYCGLLLRVAACAILAPGPGCSVHVGRILIFLYSLNLLRRSSNSEAKRRSARSDVRDIEAERRARRIVATRGLLVSDTCHMAVRSMWFVDKRIWNKPGTYVQTFCALKTAPPGLLISALGSSRPQLRAALRSALHPDSSNGAHGWGGLVRPALAFSSCPCAPWKRRVIQSRGKTACRRKHQRHIGRERERAGRRRRRGGGADGPWTTGWRTP